MIRLSRVAYLTILGHAMEGLPHEACGLLAAKPDTGEAAVEAIYPCRNAAQSPRLYEVHPLDHLRADLDAESKGLQIIGVYHSHIRSDAYPSPTDVGKAVDPGWHYVLASVRVLRETMDGQHQDPVPLVRSFHIAGEKITEEPVELEGPQT